MIKKYMKNLNNIDSKDVSSSCLSQSKLYLKILDISYFIEDTNPFVSVDVIKAVIQNTHIFNDTVLASHYQIINTLPKSDMAIVWVNIWNLQNSTKAKNLINKYFNIGYYIITIWEVSMNLGIPQYKNCWT